MAGRPGARSPKSPICVCVDRRVLQHTPIYPHIHKRPHTNLYHIQAHVHAHGHGHVHVHVHAHVHLHIPRALAVSSGRSRQRTCMMVLSDSSTCWGCRSPIAKETPAVSRLWPPSAGQNNSNTAENRLAGPCGRSFATTVLKLTHWNQASCGEHGVGFASSCCRCPALAGQRQHASS